MNGVHDMGGMHGFGPVVREADEPVFHEPWEGRVFAMALLAPFGVRRLIEGLHPARYLAASYYERWLAALEVGLAVGGEVAPAELDAKTAFFRHEPHAAVPRREDAAAAAQAVAELREHEPLHRGARVPRRGAAPVRRTRGPAAGVRRAFRGARAVGGRRARARRDPP